MLDYIFVIGASGVGKTTLAKQLYTKLDGVYIEQNMIPEFTIPDGVEDIGKFEDEICFKMMITNIAAFHDLGFKNIIALDFNDIYVREFPKIYKGSNFAIIRLICSDYDQNYNQMKNREMPGLINFDIMSDGFHSINNRPLLPNEIKIDVAGKTKEEVLEEAIQLLQKFKPKLDYDYEMPEKKEFASWVHSDNITQ